jgi:acetyl-CoA carboxylase biotin carboxyl carrier protein
MLEQTIAERVRPLAEAFRDGGLVRLAVRGDDFEVELTRSARAESAAPAAGASAERAARAEAVLADVVGVVRFTRPAVAEGAAVGEDRDLAYIETLGIRNPVRARGPGTVAAVYVTDGQPVEYGQPLFGIVPSA